MFLSAFIYLFLFDFFAMNGFFWLFGLFKPDYILYTVNARLL